MTASTYIPGSGVLGYGFNVFGTYSVESRIRPLFDMSYSEGRTHGDYLVPNNADVGQKRENYGNSFYEDSRQKAEEKFAAKASLEASYGFFSSQFEASYGSTEKSDVSLQFGLVATYSQQFTLGLKNWTEAALANWVLNDPDYQNVPDTFTKSNRDLFYEFFDKYGLYYISRVTLGARMFYSSSVSKEYGYSSEEAKAKLSLEVKAIFSAKASAEAEWKRVGENWASQRSVNVSAVGGTNQILNVLQPGFGANFEEEYKTWLASAEEQPAPIDFKLEPISEIFTSAKRAAVREAMAAYVAHKLYVESKTGSCLLSVDGKPLLPSPDGVARNLGYQLAAIDRKTLKPRIARSYATNNYWPSSENVDYEDLYKSMLKDIAPYNSPDCIILFTAFTNFAQTAPTKDFQDFLVSCGAGYGLENWIGTRDANRTIYSCCALVHTNYVFVGIPGSKPGEAREDFQRAGSCDTGQGGWWHGSPWLELPAKMASLSVDLYELELQGDTKFSLGLAR